MKALGLAIALSACASAPPATPANACAASGPSCKSAVEKAGALAKLRDRDITLAIGQCEQQAWTAPAKQCIADARATTDLTACGTKFALGTKGIFADMATLDGLFKAMVGYKEQMCACKDSKCATAVSDAMTKWGAEQEKMDREPPRMSEDDTKKFTEIGEAMGTCMQKAMTPQ